MPSQFVLSFSGLNLKCTNQGLDPIFKIKVPDCKKFTSTIAVKNNNGEYSWKDIVGFKYLCKNTIHLSEYYVTISVKDKNGKLIGDSEIDLLTIVSGPSIYDVQLSHGSMDTRLYFICSSTEYTKTTLNIENLKIFGVDTPTLFASCWLESKSGNPVYVELKKEGEDYEQVELANLDEIMSFNDTQTDFQLDFFIDDDNLFDSVRFDMSKLYSVDSLAFSFEAPSGKSIEVLLSLVNKPRFVQSTGTYLGMGRYTKYVPVEGAVAVDTNKVELSKFSEPIAQPPEGAVKTFKPFSSKINLKNITVTGEGIKDMVFIRIRNTINSKKEKIVLKKKGDSYENESYNIIPFETSKPYTLNRRFLIFELVSSNGAIIGDIYFNLHNLICGPPHYLQKFHSYGEVSAQVYCTNVINGRTMQVRFNNFKLEGVDKSKNIYLMFGFDKSEAKYEPTNFEGNAWNFKGNYEVNIFYSTASKNIQNYIINVVVYEKKMLNDKIYKKTFSSLIKVLPFKPEKKLTMQFEKGVKFTCDIFMNTSTYKPGLYGEYALLDDGLYDNGTIDTSKIKNISSFTEFGQPFYLPEVIENQEKEVPEVETLKDLECSVFRGLENQDKVKFTVNSTDIIISTLDNLPILDYSIDSDLQVSSCMNRLTLSSPKFFIQLYTPKSDQVKNYLESIIPDISSENVVEKNIEYYGLCSKQCKSAVNVTCKVCHFHPTDFDLYYYCISHCNNCKFESYFYYKNPSDPIPDCTSCGEKMTILQETVGRSFVCVCGNPIGSTCKNCDEIPTINKVYIKRECQKCQCVQIANETLADKIPCCNCHEYIQLEAN